MSILKIPFINPIHYSVIGFENDPHYWTLHMDDFQLEDSLYDFEQFTHFAQPWQINDSIRQQFISEYGPITASIVDADDYSIVYYSAEFDPVKQNVNSPTEYIYQSDLSLSILSEGYYRIKIDCGMPVSGVFPLSLISNILDVRREHNKSVLWEFKHSQMYEDVIFETGFAPAIRIKGFMRYKQPGSRVTTYEDQPADFQMVKKYNYRIMQFTTTGAGIPNYFIDILDRILGCSTLLVDNRAYAMADGAKWEEIALEGFPMRGWTIDMRENVNRGSRILENAVPVLTERHIVSVADSKGFGVDSVGGSEFNILDVE